MTCDPKFSTSVPGCDRIHHVTEEDVCVLLGRLPTDLWGRLRAVHFNDKSRGARSLGYVNRGRREIALCALPPRMSLTRFLAKGQSPEQFGARRGGQWPASAIRRFMLYDVFLHELGHLQVVHREATTVRRKFAMEMKAQAFGMEWCRRLWSRSIAHPDPVHNPPSEAELADDDPELTDLTRQIGRHPDDADLLQRLGKKLSERGRNEEAREAYERSMVLDPRDPWTHLFLGNWHYAEGDFLVATERFLSAAELMPGRAIAFWCLADIYRARGEFELADAHYRMAVEVDPLDKQARQKLRAWQARPPESPV